MCCGLRCCVYKSVSDWLWLTDGIGHIESRIKALSEAVGHRSEAGIWRQFGGNLVATWSQLGTSRPLSLLRLLRLDRWFIGPKVAARPQFAVDR